MIVYTCSCNNDDVRGSHHERKCPLSVIPPHFSDQPCGPWRAGFASPSGKIRYVECGEHGGKSRAMIIDFRHTRCNIARRALPAAR